MDIAFSSINILFLPTCVLLNPLTFVKTFNNAVREEIPEEKLKIFFEVINQINEVVESKPFETARKKQLETA